MYFFLAGCAEKQTSRFFFPADFHLLSVIDWCKANQSENNPGVLFAAAAQSSAGVLPVRSVTGTLLLTAQQILCKCVCVFVDACAVVVMTLINPYPDIWHDSACAAVS